MNWLHKVYQLSQNKSLIVAGILSGTSADAIDIAVVKFSGEPGKDLRFELLDSYSTPYSSEVKNLVKDSIGLNAEKVSALDRLIGIEFSTALKEVIKKAGNKYQIDAVASHGQTIFHHSGRGFGAGKVKSTLQVGCSDTISFETSLPVISGFRKKDISFNGEGAPITPASDFYLLKIKDIKNAAILNLGGISNITILSEKISDVIGFDTGPANAPIDRLVKIFTNSKKEFDIDGQLAKSGTVNETFLKKLLDEDIYVKRSAPKSTGFEMYGDEFTKKVIKEFGTLDLNLISTISAFVSETISYAVSEICNKQLAKNIDSLFLAGGGSKNQFIIDRLRTSLPQVTVNLTDNLGIPSDLREAIAFSFFGYCFLKSYPLDLTGITGASKPSILGSLSIPT